MRQVKYSYSNLIFVVVQGHSAVTNGFFVYIFGGLQTGLVKFAKL